MTHPDRPTKKQRAPSSSLPDAQLSDDIRSGPWSVCGRFGKPHGVRGDVRLWVYNNATEMLVPGAPVFIGTHPKKVEHDAAPPHSLLTLERARVDAKGVVASFSEISSREAATELRHLAWLAPRSAFPELEADEFYLADLMGAQGLLLPIESETQDHPEPEVLGELVGMLEAGAGEILVFKSDRWGEVMVPNLDPFVISIDVEAKVVRVRAIPGLLEGGL